MGQDNKPLDLVRVKSIIDNFDFGYVVGQAIKTGMPPQVAPQALAEFKEFLFANAAHPNIPLVPQSCWCDDLWHGFIVADTQAYFRFCEAAFGHYLHHDGVNATASELAGYRAQSAKILGKAAAGCYGGEGLPVECTRGLVQSGDSSSFWALPAPSPSSLTDQALARRSDCAEG